MMKKILLLISCLAFLTLTFADDPCQSSSGPYGPTVCSKGITQSVSANGSVTMHQTTVQDATQVNGDLTATQVILLHTLTVTGDVTLSQAIVLGTTTITGSLSATNSIFDDTLTVATNKLSLADCHTADIIITSSGDGVVSPQTLTLTGKTEVDGDITFKAKDGVVNVGPNVKITGKVIDGKIIKQAAKTTATAKTSSSSESS